MRFLPLILLSLLATPNLRADNDASSLQDISSAVWNDLPQVTIYPAREILTLDGSGTIADAVAVVGYRILATGRLEDLINTVGDQTYEIDETFAEKVIIPGFIAQHDHPFLAAITLASEILSIEEWALPTGTVPAVKDKEDFLTRLGEAAGKMTDPDEALFSWGYHPSFYGNLTRADLNGISETRPIIILARSCHEFIVNDAALKEGGITDELVSSWSESEQQQSDFEEGRFWEQGAKAILKSKLPLMIFTPERLQLGLEISRDYMHAKGITFGNEPGGILNQQLQDSVNAVFSQPDMPFRWTFMVDGKTMCDKYDDDEQVLAESEKLQSWYTGFTSQAEKTVKLFADGAIYSQLMQLREPYLDGHEGEWMTDLDVYQRAFRVYWDAGYQIHIHVNGDAGVDRVLNTLETNIRRNPRNDHRTTIVHFAVSAEDQVDRMKQLGCIISGNPYYVRALADNYSEVGLGPERADQMVRMGDVERADISYSFHSDMPMAPADPLFLMWCGVNRLTTSERVAGENQKVSREGALRAVTSEAAYSLKMEHEIGSIESGKLANFTILDDNPVTCEPMAIKDIGVWGTVHEGTPLPAPEAGPKTAQLLDSPSDRAPTVLSAKERAQMIFAKKATSPDAVYRNGCSCQMGRVLSNAYLEALSRNQIASR